MLLFNNDNSNIDSSNRISINQLLKSHKKLQLPILPISNKTLMDELKIFYLTHPQKYNNIFINNDIPNKSDINQDYIYNNLDTIYIDYNTIQKIIFELQKKGLLSNKLNNKISENQELLNLCKNKLSQPLNKSQLIQLIKDIDRLNYEKENLNKIALLNKYQYLSTFKNLHDINQEKYLIYNNYNKDKYKSTLINTKTY